MFSSKRKPAVAKAKSGAGGAGLSLIGAELAVSGDLVSGGQIHIDGRVDGNVRCASLCQSESGVIAGDIEADEARIGGVVEGGVKAKTVMIEASGRVAGDVAYDTISIAAGAQIEGRLARRAALARNEDAPAALIATPAKPGEETAPGTLFSGRPTPVAAV